MCEDMLQLTVDQVFPAATNEDAQDSRREKRVHPVEGYHDDINMWQKLTSDLLEIVNCRSLIMLQVGNSTFRLRKNPLFKN